LRERQLDRRDRIATSCIARRSGTVIETTGGVHAVVT
jgi:hypothetical protein